MAKSQIWYGHIIDKNGKRFTAKGMGHECERGADLASIWVKQRGKYVDLATPGLKKKLKIKFPIYPVESTPFCDFPTKKQKDKEMGRMKNPKKKTPVKKKAKTPKGRGPQVKKNGYRKHRPSPSDSATLYPSGKRKRGNDGNMWSIRVNSNGVHRWVKDSKKK